MEQNGFDTQYTDIIVTEFEKLRENAQMKVVVEQIVNDEKSIMRSLINNGDLIPTARFAELTGVDTLTVDNFSQVAEALWDTSEIALWKRVE